MGQKRLEHGTRPRRAYQAVALLLLLAALLGAASSCGGGGGRSAAAPLPSTPQTIAAGVSNLSITPSAGILFPPGLSPRMSDATRYEPLLNSWYIFDGTDDWTWYSAVGSTEGLTASMSNPWEGVAVAFIPGSTGQVNFYIDGVATGTTLDLSLPVPYEGYSSEYTTFYTIAQDMPETMHTVTMEIASGSVRFDGWRIKYEDNFYRIDAGEVNTLEANTMSTHNQIRDAAEEYYQDFGQFANPPQGSSLTTYLYAQGYLSSLPKNQFTGNTITDTGTTYSGGDYDYTYESATDYSLSVYGGRGILDTVTPNTAATEYVGVAIATPTNHFTTTSEWATFTVTPVSVHDATLSISGGLSGTRNFPATSTESFTTTVKLKQGRNDIYVTVYDNYNNSVNLKRTITLDTTAPDIALLTPYPQVWEDDRIFVNVYTATTTVSVLVEDGATVTINGESVSESTRDDGVFSTVIDLAAGSNIITITATDLWGNKNETTFEIVRN